MEGIYYYNDNKARRENVNSEEDRDEKEKQSE